MTRSKDSSRVRSATGSRLPRTLALSAGAALVYAVSLVASPRAWGTRSFSVPSSRCSTPFSVHVPSLPPFANFAIPGLAVDVSGGLVRGLEGDGHGARSRHGFR